MKILNPHEYKEQNPSAYLDDYLSYLETAQKEAEETLQNAKALLDDSSILNDIQKQAEEIFQMAMLVEEYMGQIVLKSVDTLSLEELQSYFNFDNENKQADERKAQLEEEKKTLKSRLTEIEKQIANNLYSNGRVKEFYEAEDVKLFFQENQDPYQFLEALLNAFDVITPNENIAEQLKKQLEVVLRTEGQIQNIELSANDIDELSEKIIELFKKCKNILNYSPGAKTQLTKVILSESGIRQILPDTFDENTALYMIQGLMNLKKLKTTFYTNLPYSLQEQLVKGRLQGEPYETLLRTYQAFLSGEELPSDDLSIEEKEEKKELEENLERLNYDLVSVDAEKESHKKFLVNRDAMRSVLKEMILGTLQGQVSAKDIDSIIKEAENKTERLKSELLEASNLLSTKAKTEKANFITRNLPAHKESLRQLDEQYKKTIEEAFQTLKQKKLFYINTPQISDESTVGNVIVLPPKEHQPEPTNFSEVNGLKQSFWNMSTGIDENTKQKFLTMNAEMDWETYYQNLMQTQSELITKLLSFEVGEDGYYTFASTPEEREELKTLQITIIGILSSIYNERKAFRESLGDTPSFLEQEKITELEYFLGHGSNLSRENLAAYIDQTQSKIEALKTLLANNRALCLKLEIEVPEDVAITHDSSEEDNHNLENRIQSLDIEGVTNLEEAIAYRNLLLGLEEYTVPPAKVKQFYLEHKK